jgi:hypothetical protein
MTLVRVLTLTIVVFFLPSLPGGQTQTRTDVWEPLRFFIGQWEGTGTGKPGISKMQREYRLALNERFLHVQNRSTYEPQEKNPKGELHEDWGMISFDKSRKQFVFRQFHVEGFVTHYVAASISEDGKTIVFNSESIENIPAGWRARETYKILSADKFVEVFELAAPGKEFETYSEARLRRKK